MAQRPLTEPPTDGISCLAFAPSSNFLLASSWDKTLRLYDVDSARATSKFEHMGPVLTCAMASDNVIFGGGLDQTVHMHDVGGETDRVLGTHEQAVRCMCYSHDLNTLISAGWDSRVYLWDPRSATSLQASITLADRAYAMSLCGGERSLGGATAPRVVVGTRGRRIQVWDLRRPDRPEIEKDSPLRHQTRTIAGYADGTGFAVGSIEGRVAMEWLDPSEEVQARRYAFKCHRVKKDGVDEAFPVNSIAFHPGYGTFATGGCDGMVYFWDGANQKRLGKLGPFETSVASLEFNHDGSLLAIAASYTFEAGDKPHPADAILIHTVADGEVRPKAKRG